MTERPHLRNGFGSRSLHYRDDPPDPLTDSGVHRGMAMGTVVRLHLWGETESLDISLLDFVGVSTWYEVASYIRQGIDLEVRPPHCMVIKGPSIRWVELIRPCEE